MDLHQLRSFYEVVREQSFTRAADKLFLTQPAHQPTDQGIGE